MNQVSTDLSLSSDLHLRARVKLDSEQQAEKCFPFKIKARFLESLVEKTSCHIHVLTAGGFRLINNILSYADNLGYIVYFHCSSLLPGSHVPLRLQWEQLVSFLNLETLRAWNRFFFKCLHREYPGTFNSYPTQLAAVSMCSGLVL